MSYCSIGFGDTALITRAGSAVFTGMDSASANGEIAMTGMRGGGAGSVSPGARNGVIAARYASNFSPIQPASPIGAS